MKLLRSRQPSFLFSLVTQLFIFELEHPFIDNPAGCTKRTAIRLGAQGEDKLFAMANEAKIPMFVAVIRPQ